MCLCSKRIPKDTLKGGNNSSKFINDRNDFKLDGGHTVDGRNKLAELVIDKLQTIT